MAQFHETIKMFSNKNIFGPLGRGRHAMNLGIKYLRTTDTTQKTAKKLKVGQKRLFWYFSRPPIPQGIDTYAVRGGRSPQSPQFLKPWLSNKTSPAQP